MNFKKYKNALLVIAGASFCLMPLHGMKSKNSTIMDMDIDPEVKVNTETNNQKDRLRKLFGIPKNQNEKTFDWLKKQKKSHKHRLIDQLRLETDLYREIIKHINTNIKNKSYDKRLSLQKYKEVILFSIKKELLPEMVNNIIIVARETQNMQRSDVINLLNSVKNNIQNIPILKNISGKDDIVSLIRDVLDEIDLWGTFIHPK